MNRATLNSSFLVYNFHKIDHREKISSINEKCELMTSKREGRLISLIDFAMKILEKNEIDSNFYPSF